VSTFGRMINSLFNTLLLVMRSGRVGWSRPQWPLPLLPSSAAVLRQRACPSPSRGSAERSFRVMAFVVFASPEFFPFWPKATRKLSRLASMRCPRRARRCPVTARRRSGVLDEVEALAPERSCSAPRLARQCQSALDWDPLSASKRGSDAILMTCHHAEN
jgi:hypothetical protein